MNKLHSAIIAAMISLAALADGRVLWVDKAKGWDGAGRGSESSPYRTIQAAVNAAASGDTIKVKPGVYDEGFGSYNVWNNRVLISGKVLRIVSTGGKDVTHITGSGTMRCVCFHGAEGSVVEGFTIRDGVADYVSDNDAVNGSGGGAVGLTADKQYSKAQACVVDCVVSNCVGVRGGAFRSVTAVRCWITENTASNSGAAGRKTDFVNCLVSRNFGPHSCIFDDSKVVNCTVVDNERCARETTSLYNSVVLNNSHDGTNDDNVWAVVTSVSSITNASPFQFIAPLYDDFRVLKWSDTETAGDASLIDSVGVTVPAGVDLHKDLFANSIPASGTIAAGCIQTVVEPQGGAMLFKRGRLYRTLGKMAYGKDLYAFAETYPTQFVVQAVNKGNPAIFSFEVNGADVFPTMDDTICITPPASSGVVCTNDVRNPVTRYYVDPNNGSDAAAGTSAATALKTFQQVNEKVKNSPYTWFVIHAAAGDYREGAVAGDGYAKRACIRGNMRVIGAGADKSVIWGAPDSSTGGMGENGMRCVYSFATSGCIQGFTIRDGYADGSTSGDTAAQRGGGVYVDSSSAYKTSTRILDCVITNCWAYRGGAGYSGSYERCHITDCHGDGGVVRYAYLVSCIVDNLHGSEMANNGNNNQFGRAFNTTFIGRNTSEYVVSRASGTTFTNCIVMTTQELLSGTVGAGSIAWDTPAFTVASGFTLTDPKLADVAGADYRPVYNDRHKVGQADDWSPALGAGVWFDMPGFNVTDFDGKPLNLIAGKPTVGAYQWPFVKVEKPGFRIIFR